MRRFAAILALLPAAPFYALAVPEAPPAPADTLKASAFSKPDAATKNLGDIQRRLQHEFDALLDMPSDYAGRVRKDCSLFPEGDLFPYVMPAFAYANLAVRDPSTAGACRVRVAQLIDLAIPAVVKRVQPPGGKLENLAGYSHHATYLGELNLALACYRMIGGDGRYDAMHDAISETLRRALADGDGHPLDSYPWDSWSFDTVPCLLSLKLHDRKMGKDAAGELTRKHLRWLDDHGTDPLLGLPYSRVGVGAGAAPQPPRGCDLSLRLCLLANLDRERAQKMYRSYTASFWLDRMFVAGFAEWPSGKAGAEDADSGPVLLGIGSAATGFGIGAAQAMEDKARLGCLTRQLGEVQAIRKLAAEQGFKSALQSAIPSDDRCVTGFLFGDACLFYAVTWTSWMEGGEGSK